MKVFSVKIFLSFFAKVPPVKVSRYTVYLIYSAFFGISSMSSIRSHLHFLQLQRQNRTSMRMRDGSLSPSQTRLVAMATEIVQ